MKIMITGGAGCLGSNIIEYYYPKGHEICVIDNFATGKREVVPEKKKLLVYEGSISDKNIVDTVFNEFQPTHVIHSAASYKDPTNWSEDISTNVLGMINVIDAAKNAGVKKLINFQTALCYGYPKIIPIPVDHQLNPFTSYGISKTAGEAYALLSELPVISLRLSNICAPRLAIGPIPTFYKRLKEEKNCFCSDSKRDFLDIKDFFNLLDKIINSDVNSGIFNVSTGNSYSIHEVFNAVAGYLGLTPPTPPIVPVGEDDVPEVVLDPAETENVFNWKAEIDFVTTIENQLRWYDEFGVNDVFSHLQERSI